MICDNLFFFTKDSNLMADMSVFVRSMNASLLSIYKEFPSLYSQEQIDLVLEEDRQWVCYDC